MLSLFIPLFLGCGKEEDDSGKLTVVTTTTMITDMVRELCGPHAEVHGLMGPGVDPHLYKATAGDVTHLQNADLIFYSGLHLEGRMTDLFVKMSRQGKEVWALTENIPEDRLLEPPEFQGLHDPHVWFDPEIWVLGIDVAVKALSKVDPVNASTYKERGDDLRTRYLELHQWAKQRAATLPENNRTLVTSHDAFNYFGRAYGFKVIGVQGISTVTEAGLADIARTVDLIRERKVKAIFVESSVSPATIQRISEDSGAVIGGELFSDAMGSPGQMETANGETYDAGTYEGMLRHNINTVVEALK